MSVKFFGQWLLDRELIAAEQLVQAIELQETRNVKLGTYAVRRGLITVEQADAIAAAQRWQDRRFGELAVEMGYLTAQQIDELVTMQQNDHLYLGGALVVLGFMDKVSVEKELADFKVDQSQYTSRELALPETAPYANELSLLISLTQKLAIRLCDYGGKWGQGMPAPPPPPPKSWTVGIALVGGVTATFSLTCAEPVARRLARALFGEKAEEVASELVRDALGEFANLVCGNAAALWARSGKRVELGTPTPGLTPALGSGYSFPLHFPEGILDVRV